MARVWLTYAWSDNTHGDVDFVAQELERKGLTVKMDRWNIGTGRRLWDQIDHFIRSPSESDGWVIFATQASLGSEPCREEFAYALDRALAERGGSFTVAAIFPGHVDTSILPAGLKTRLGVTLTDIDWAERVAAGVEGRDHVATRKILEPYHLTTHPRGDGSFDIEVRPRAGTWVPFIAAIPAGENEKVRLNAMRAAAGGNRPDKYVMMGYGEGISDDGQWAVVQSQEEATPTMSFYINCRALPTQLLFGASPNLFLVKPQEWTALK